MKLSQELAIHSAPVTAIEYSERTLVSASESGLLALADVATGTIACSIQETAPITSCKFADKTIYYSTENLLKAWDTVNQTTSVIHTVAEEINQIDINPINSYIGIVEDSGQVHVYDIKKGALAKRLHRSHSNVIFH